MSGIDYEKLLEDIRETFSPIASGRKELRKNLLDSGYIHSFANRDPLGDPATSSLCAVDGARITKKLYILDLLIAQAVAANGKVSPEHPLPDPEKWAATLARDKGTDHVAGAAMAALEVRLLQKATHETRILDGSFITPLIDLREGLYSSNNSIVKTTMDIVNNPDTDPTGALLSLYAPEKDRPVLALTKADTSTAYSPIFSENGFKIKGILDRTVATQILHPGEFLSPTVMRYGQLQADRSRAIDGPAKRTAGKIDEIAGELKRQAQEDHVRTLFFKPHNAQHTVLKLDYFSDSPDLDIAKKFVEIVNQDTRAPHMLEPYSQWMADEFAKTIKVEPDRIQQMIVSKMTPEERETMGPLILSAYRTRL